MAFASSSVMQKPRHHCLEAGTYVVRFLQKVDEPVSTEATVDVRQTRHVDQMRDVRLPLADHVFAVRPVERPRVQRLMTSAAVALSRQIRESLFGIVTPGALELGDHGTRTGIGKRHRVVTAA